MLKQLIMCQESPAGQLAEGAQEVEWKEDGAKWAFCHLVDKDMHDLVFVYDLLQ